MSGWTSKGANWTSADTLRGSRAVFEESSEAIAERAFAKKTANWTANGCFHGGGYDMSDFLYAFDYSLLGGVFNNMDWKLQVTEDYWHHNSGVGEPQWEYIGDQWYPISWTAERFLEETGDPAWLELKLGEGYTPALEYFIQRYKAINLSRRYFGNGTYQYGSGQTQVQFTHPTPNAPAYYKDGGAATGYFPAHTWEIWYMNHLVGNKTKTPVKIYSEDIATEMVAGDPDYKTAWITVSSFESDVQYQSVITNADYAHIMKFESGFQYKDW